MMLSHHTFPSKTTIQCSSLTFVVTKDFGKGSDFISLGFEEGIFWRSIKPRDGSTQGRSTDLSSGKP